MSDLLARDFLTITDEDIEAWIDDRLGNGDATKSIRKRHGLLSPIMEHGSYKMKLRPDNPCRFSDLPALDGRRKRQIRFFLHDEWALLRACLQDDVHLLADTLAPGDRDTLRRGQRAPRR